MTQHVKITSLGRKQTRLELWEEHFKDPIPAVDKALEVSRKSLSGVDLLLKVLAKSHAYCHGLQLCGHRTFCKRCGKGRSGNTPGLCSDPLGQCASCALTSTYVGMFHGSMGRMASSFSSFIKEEPVVVSDDEVLPNPFVSAETLKACALTGLHLLPAGDEAGSSGSQSPELGDMWKYGVVPKALTGTATLSHGQKAKALLLLLNSANTTWKALLWMPWSKTRLVNIFLSSWKIGNLQGCLWAATLHWYMKEERNVIGESFWVRWLAGFLSNFWYKWNMVCREVRVSRGRDFLGKCVVRASTVDLHQCQESNHIHSFFFKRKKRDFFFKKKNKDKEQKQRIRKKSKVNKVKKTWKVEFGETAQNFW